ncbi:hypothetical protein IKF12_02015 [Candidatus Saccharibacteria bacterium]|nr:hypothetical protein [Candidatus Saccharibacteria bacterium]
MKNKTLISTAAICSGLAVLGLASATASALEYQTNPSAGDNPVTLKFEFGSTLNITTGGNISISDLTPGTKAISASNYNVTVSTNNLTGYTLSATVGCSSGTDCYDSKNLSDGTNTFSMLSADGALTAGTWGVSLDSNATANSNFKTLAKYDETATTINKTTSSTGTAATGYTGTANTTVRVGAYATASQVAGTYTNSINFIAVANAVPNCGNYIADYCMQDQTQSSLASIMPNVGDEVTMTDSRDGKTYTVAHLADGNYWMTQNLDHDIVTTANFYTPSNTDISTNWTASTATYGTGTTTWNSSYTAPESYDPGDLCWNGIIRSDYNGTLSNSTTACGDDKHYHIGNYYNWTAAIAMNDSSSYTTDEQDVNQSICPAGWRLPTYSGDKSYANLVSAANLTSGTSGNIQNAPAYFVYGGYWSGSSGSVGGYGGYWSSVVSDDYGYGAYRLCFYRTGVLSPHDGYDRDGGNSVRCVAR